MLSFLIASLTLTYSALAQDCTIVKNAYEAMGKQFLSWPQYCCGIEGVYCPVFYSGWGPVLGIDWSRQGLKGQIPSTLGSLTNLRYLYLHSNQLTGPIPPLENLNQLTHLGLHSNQLNGPIPPSLGNLNNLTWLWLSDNQLTGAIPASLGNLTQLTYLYLSKNHLTGPIPSSFENLTQLRYLSLKSNQINGTIPSSLGSLAELRYLALNDNQLSGPIPPSLGNLNQLTWLLLSANQLSGSIPSSLGNLAKLTSLDLSNNQLTDLIPSSLGNLNQLTSLYSNYNKLTGVPSSLGNLQGTVVALLPNPMSLVPYDILVKTPISTMSAENFTDFLGTEILVKRAQSSSIATLTNDQLLKLCPLNFITSKDIPAGCVAGIVKFCQGQKDLTQCHKYYDTVFSSSVYASIGANCPAWKYGPKSTRCTDAVKRFSVSLVYNKVSKEFATFLVNTLFMNKELAPCKNVGTLKCIW